MPQAEVSRQQTEQKDDKYGAYAARCLLHLLFFPLNLPLSAFSKSLPTFWGTPFSLAFSLSWAIISMKLCCFFDVLGICFLLICSCPRRRSNYRKLPLRSSPRPRPRPRPLRLPLAHCTSRSSPRSRRNIEPY